jgi:hypothetical protein
MNEDLIHAIRGSFYDDFCRLVRQHLDMAPASYEGEILAVLSECNSIYTPGVPDRHEYVPANGTWSEWQPGKAPQNVALEIMHHSQGDPNISQARSLGADGRAYVAIKDGRTSFFDDETDEEIPDPLYWRFPFPSK